MQKFKEHLTEERQDHQSFLRETVELITEKLIVFRGKRSKFGRVIFLAGGGGSGKGFAMTNFLDVSQGTDKIRDVDEWKGTFQKIAALQKKWPEIQNLDMSNPEDVFKIHMWIKDKGIKDKSLNLLLGDLRSKNLPNIVFDVTLKKRADIENVIPRLLEVGYNPLDIHLVWILTNFDVAIKNNLDPKRGRVVPEEALLQTHLGAATNMWDILKGNVPKGLNGEIHVINNNRENTVFLKDDKGKPIPNNNPMGPLRTLGINKKEPTFVIQNFLSIQVKESGKSLDPPKKMQRKLMFWIRSNTPKQLKLF